MEFEYKGFKLKLSADFLSMTVNFLFVSARFVNAITHFVTLLLSLFQ